MKINNNFNQNFKGNLKVNGDNYRYLTQKLKNNKMLQTLAKEAGEYDIVVNTKFFNGNGLSRGTDGNFYKIVISKEKQNGGFFEALKTKLNINPSVNVSKKPHGDKNIIEILQNRFNIDLLKEALKIK